MLLMWLRENPKVSLKIKYKKNLHLSLIVTLALFSLMFVVFPKFGHTERIIDQPEIEIEVQDIPQTQQIKRPPPPSRPAIPIETESEDILDDVTIEDTEFDFSDVTPPPPPPSEEEEETPIFLTWDEAPEPVGGLIEIFKNLEYPEIARKAGIDGTVLVQAVIDEEGNILDCSILKGLGNNGTSEAAIKAVRSVKWIPGKQRDRPVKVKLTIPIKFKLN